MRSGRVIKGAALFALPFLFVTSAYACSMAPGYKVPTNLELAAAADTIVVATIEGERKAESVWDGTILFLKREPDGSLSPYRSSFSRDAEDVPSDDALWVKTVREYARISQQPAGARKAALKNRIGELSAMTDDPDAAAIAQDMEIELKGKRLPPFD
jgi:hypothetical protein